MGSLSALELLLLVSLSLSLPIFNVLLEQLGVEFCIIHAVSVLRPLGRGAIAITLQFSLSHHLFPSCVVVQLIVFLPRRLSWFSLTLNL